MNWSEKGERSFKDELLKNVFYCTSDEDDRRQFYNSCRTRYLTGSDWPKPKARTNKISPIVKRKAAFTYSGEGLKFWMEPSTNEEIGDVFDKLEPASQALETEWIISGTDDCFSLGVEWAYVYGAMIITTLPVWNERQRKSYLKTLLVHPADFSVMRRETPETGQQELLILSSYLSMADIERKYRYFKDKAKLMRSLEQIYEGDLANSGSIQNIIMGPGASTFQANWIGARGPYTQTGIPLPLYRFRDIYYYDDATGEWWVCTLSGDMVVAKRPLERLGVGPIPPFTKICPRPLPDNYWGVSEVEQLTSLQDWYVYRMGQTDRFLAKQLRPSRAAFGLGKGFEEDLAALDRPGGTASFGRQDANIQEFKTELPSGIFELLEGISDFFLDESGLRPSMFGKAEPGVRTEGMAATTMRVSAAEIRKEARIIEKNVTDHANILFEQMRLHNDEPQIDINGKLFYLSQLPADIQVRVDGQSNSPLFVEDHAQLAMALRKYNDITPEKFIELLHPAMKGALLWDVRRTQMVKLLAQELQKQAQQQQREGRVAGMLGDKGGQ